HWGGVAGARGGCASGAEWNRPERTEHQRQPRPSAQRGWQPGESASRLGGRRRRTRSLVARHELDQPPYETMNRINAAVAQAMELCPQPELVSWGRRGISPHAPAARAGGGPRPVTSRI